MRVVEEGGRRVEELEDCERSWKTSAKEIG